MWILSWRWCGRTTGKLKKQERAFWKPGYPGFGLIHILENRTSEEEHYMIHPVISYETLYPGMTDVEKIKRISERGFPLMEFWGWKGKPLDEIEEIMQRSDVRIMNFSGHRAGDLIDRNTHDILIEDIKGSIAVAQKLGTKILMVLSNELGDEGVVVHPCEHLSASQKHANVVECVKRILEYLPDDMTIVLEPLNTLVDHMNNYLYRVEDAAEIVDEVGDTRVRILFDMYHQSVMGDDLEYLMKNYMQYIGYIHIADCPGRHEPGTGTVDWDRMLKTAALAGYDGCVGFEYFPLGDSTESLTAVRNLWDRVFG